MSPLAAARFTSLSSVLSKILALLASAAGYAVLLGWRLDIPSLKSLVPNGPTVPMPVAAALVLLGGCAWFLPSEECKKQTRSLASVAAALAGILALLNLEYVFFGWQWSWMEKAYQFIADDAPSASHWMSVPAGLCFLSYGVALLLFHASTHTAKALWTVLPGALISLAALLAALLETKSPLALALPWPTATSILVLGAAVVLAHPQLGLLALLTSDSAGGEAARRLLPIAVVAPALLAWLRIIGQRAGWYGTELGTVLFAVAAIAISGSIISLLAVAVHRLDSRHLAAQRALKENKARLNLALKSGGISIWTWNMDTDISSSDEMLPQLLGLNDDSFTGGLKGLLEVMHPDDKEALLAQLTQCTSAGDVLDTEFRVVWPDSSIHRLAMRGQVYPDALGKPVRMTGVCQDVTSRHPADSSSIPVASAPQQLLPSPTSKEPLVLSEVKMEEIWQSVLAHHSAAISASQAMLGHDPLPEVLADPAQVHLLLQHLVDNALKFRSDAAPVIHLAVEGQENTWQFCLSDNGIGIDPLDVPKLFQLFQRLHPHFPGAGAGLALCKEIVERHAGRIWLESEPAKGTKFFFTLPSEPKGPEGTPQPEGIS